MKKRLPSAAEVLDRIREAGARLRRRNQDELNRRALLSIIVGSVMFHVRQRAQAEETAAAVKREKQREYHKQRRANERAKLVATGRPSKVKKIADEYADLTPRQRMRRQLEVIEQRKHLARLERQSQADAAEERRMEEWRRMEEERIAALSRPTITQEEIDSRPVCYAPHCMRCSHRLNSQGQHVCSLAECIIPTMAERKARAAADLARCTADPEGQTLYNPMPHVSEETMRKQPQIRERVEYYKRPFSWADFDAEPIPRIDFEMDSPFPDTGGMSDTLPINNTKPRKRKTAHTA